ncbi:MAG: hypothetical protein ACI37R_04050 [Candidatus Avigastranaerophilus sp.]
MDINFQQIITSSPETANNLKEASEDGLTANDVNSIFDSKDLTELGESTGISAEDGDISSLSNEELEIMISEIDQAMENLGDYALWDINDLEGEDLKLNDYTKIAEYINGNVNEDGAEDLTVQSLIYNTELLPEDEQRKIFEAAGLDISKYEPRIGKDENGNDSIYFNNPETNECIKALINGDGSTLIVHTTIQEGTAVGKTEIYKMNEEEPSYTIRDYTDDSDDSDDYFPDYTPEPFPTAEPEPAPTTEPEPAPTTEPEPAPTAEPEPAPTTEPEPAPTTEPEPAPTTQPDLPDSNLGDEVDPVNPGDSDTPNADETPAAPPIADDTADDTPIFDDTPDEIPPAADDTGDNTTSENDTPANDSENDAPCDDKSYTDNWVDEERPE